MEFTPMLLNHSLTLAAILFALGVLGLLVRRNLVFVLMSVEAMLNAAGLVFVAAGRRWGQAEGQIMFLLILAMAAAEVCVGLALFLRYSRRVPSLDSDQANRMHG